jgi:hypothetical protein
MIINVHWEDLSSKFKGCFKIDIGAEEGLSRLNSVTLSVFLGLRRKQTRFSTARNFSSFCPKDCDNATQ